MKQPVGNIRWMWLAPALICLALLTALSRPVAATAQVSGSPDGLWRVVNESAIAGLGLRWVVPDSYRTLALNLQRLTSHLAGAPLEYTSAARGALPPSRSWRCRSPAAPRSRRCSLHASW